MAKHDADEIREKTPLETIIDRCSTSRVRRRSVYRLLRQWYQRGTTTGGEPALFNRLHTHVELLSSMCYAPESARFYISVSPKDRKRLMDKLDIARDAWNQTWRNTGSDVEFASDVEWAVVYGTVILKIIRTKGAPPRKAVIDPSAFGVMREDIMQLDRQPAFVHWYVISIPELKEKIRNLPEAEQTEILMYAQQSAFPNNSAGVDSGLPGGMVSDVIVTSVSNTESVTGFLDLSAVNADRPEVTEPLVELAEVWVRSEFERKEPNQPEVKFWDWKVYTCLDRFKLWETRNPVLPYVPANPGAEEDCIEAENPFIILRPKPIMDYFWGRSGIANLTKLQEVADGHLEDIRDMMGRQLDPSAFLSGFQGMPDKLEPLRKKGGFVSSALPGAKLQPLTPTMPPQAFDLLSKFDEMFNEEGGIPADLGTAQDEIRVQGQIQGTSRKMGRIRKTALIIEDQLEVLATRMFHAMQRDDETEFETEDGDTFMLANLPSTAVVKVSAHSASPVYAEQTMEKAMLLFKAQAIDADTLVELVDPPMAEMLREKAKRLMQAQAQTAKEQMRIEELKVTRPARR